MSVFRLFIGDARFHLFRKYLDPNWLTPMDHMTAWRRLRFSSQISKLSAWQYGKAFDLCVETAVGPLWRPVAQLVRAHD